MNTKRCAHCSKDIPQVAQHCVFCGQKQPQQAPTEAKTMLGYSVADIMGGKPAPGPSPLAPPPGAFGGGGPPPAGPPAMGGPPPAAAPMGGPPPGAQPISEARTMFLGNQPGAPGPAAPMGPPGGAPPLGPPPGMGGPPGMAPPMGGPPPGMAPPMGGPPMGGPQMHPMGPPPGAPYGSSPQPIAPMQIASPHAMQQPMRPMQMPGMRPMHMGQASALDDSYAGQYRLWGVLIGIFGLLWFIGLIVLSPAPGMMFKAIFKGNATFLLYTLGVPVFSLVLLVMALMPVGAMPRALVHLLSGAILIILLLVPGHGFGAPGIPGGASWVGYVALLGFVLAGGAMFVRGHDGEEGHMVARILSGVGGAALLALFLVPQHGTMPVVAMLKSLGGGGGTANQINTIVGLLLIVLAAMALLSVFVTPIGRLGGIIGLGIALLPTIAATVLAVVTVIDSKGASGKEKAQMLLAAPGPGMITILALALGLGFFIHKLDNA